MLAEKRIPWLPLWILLAAAVAAAAVAAVSFAAADPTERIVNGTFDKDLSGWLDTSFPLGTDGYITWNDNRLELGSGGKGYGQAEQRVAVVSGAEYCFSADVQGSLSWAAITVGTKQNDQARIFLLNGLSSGRYERCFTAPATEIWVLLNSGGGSWWADNGRYPIYWTVE